MLITPHYNDEVNFAIPCYNEDKTSRNLPFPTSKPKFTLCFNQSVVGHDEFSAFKSPFHAFFSHVAFFNLFVVNDEFPLHHSHWTTGRTILRSVLNMDRGKLLVARAI